MTDRYDLAIPPDHAQADPAVQRVITLHNRWCEEGPPPAGVSMRHWWGLRLAELEAALRPAADKPLPSIHANDVHGFCPACGHPTLRLDEDGRITCTLMDCPRPDLVNEVIGEIGDARQHAAYTFCDQLVGHVSMREFAKKITEKVTAVAHREEAVKYANEQKQRADQAEELLRIAHETSNKSETERARAAAALACVREYADRIEGKGGGSGARTATRAIAACLRQLADETGPAATEATEPHTGLVVQPYRNDRGENAWVFRCWGTDDGCDGWLSLDHYSEQSATRARDRHAAEEHGPAGTEGTEEHNLAHALGGDRTAKTIAHTLTAHGHTLDAVRTMTYAELLAVPGIGGPSLARIRAALDGWPEPDGTDQAKAERCCVCGSAAVVYHNHREQPFCWPCADCPCGQDACIRTGLHRTAAEKQADAQAEIAELERNNRALVECAERAGVRRDQLAATLREVLDAFARVTSPTSGGVMGYQAPPIHPDDMSRWRAVLEPTKEQR